MLTGTSALSLNTTANNGSFDIPDVLVPVTVVDRNNIQSVLIDSGFYKASDFAGLP